jgi:hypothetical protein
MSAYWNRVSRMTREQRQEEALREMVGPSFAALFGAPMPQKPEPCAGCRVNLAGELVCQCHDEINGREL